MENGVQHSRMHYVHPLTDVSCFRCKCIGKGKVVVLPKSLILIFLINGIIKAILVAFSMKMSEACTGMLSYENNAFKCSKKKCENHKQYVHHVHHTYRTRGTFIFLQTSLSFTRNMSVKVAVVLYYIFSKITNFGYW